MVETQNQSQNMQRQQAPQHQGGILSQDKKNQVDPEKLEEMGGQLKSVTTRLRTLEEKYRNMRAGIQTTEKNSLEESKKINAEISDVNQEVYSLKKDFKDLKEKMDIIIKELGLTAKKEEVESIQKYLDLWNPVNFVSQNEILPIVKRALTDMGIRSKGDIERIKDVDDEKQDEKEGF
ncbi:MAG: hypothetical protein ACLFSL_03215 [Candidatus Woesearchaeota archaeon]